MIDPSILRERIPALRPLSDDALEHLARIAVERRYATRAVLYRAGDAADALYLVLAGRVRVARVAADGRSRLLHAEGPGGVLGEIPVFGGGAYPATATATEPTRCARIGAAALDRLLAERPEVARFALRRLAERARSLLARLDDVQEHTVPSRVAAVVLARARHARGRDFTLGMSQAALAEELGTAREVVVRALGTLCAAGAVRRTGRARYAVASMDVLDAMSG
ncbi:cyclic nucleotide-binding protein [Gemmatirosa kalamazoonensis]|uniref:Cyclic nucleotide-binding protein n=1 Tax=Gemmatirosa kalamazoonensis TaxID=861299 RepID=W0REU6_9BACT|nr:Crp/Fnr family transcriptional regulator [Gemmatirosa kalamazoonensis]AHG88850.1 cyclic nucleotide-binding protein [Gemmatirosa kalamazoonensis]